MNSIEDLLTEILTTVKEIDRKIDEIKSPARVEKDAELLIGQIADKMSKLI